MRMHYCMDQCRHKNYRVDNFFISMFLTFVKNNYGVDLASKTNKGYVKCQSFCVFYVVFMEVGNQLFQYYWQKNINRAVTGKHNMVFRCSHCGKAFTPISSVEHVFQQMVERKINPSTLPARMKELGVEM